MSRIFLSHSSLDNLQAIALKTWLINQDPPLAGEIFLDLDRDTGIAAGTRWEDELRRANNRCEAIICVVSRNWEASAECKAEYRIASILNKRIFAVRIEDLPDDVTREWQRVDLFGGGETTPVEVTIDGATHTVHFRTDGLFRLRDGIRGAGISAQSFVWPPPRDPKRAPYRGWDPLDEVDAAVFFGRDAQIVAGLDELRRLRKTGIKSLFVILGPSGAGKSSFLRAGLLPRLRRDDHDFLVIGLVRPASSPITGTTGLAEAIFAARNRYKLPTMNLGDIEIAARTDPSRIRELLEELQDRAHGSLPHTDDETARPPTLVLAVDQAEELFAADAGPEATEFLHLIAAVARPQDGRPRLDLIVAATIRTDRFHALQTAPELEGVDSVEFADLKPMPRTQFKEVITGPAGRDDHDGSPLALEPAFVNQILTDAEVGADALPLLALTLSRLYRKYGADGDLTLAEYTAMGGLRDVVRNEVDSILSRDPAVRADELDLLHTAFIPWLATVNPDDDQPLRRVADYDDLPAASHDLIDKFVEKRLLVKGADGDRITVEVALESLLRQWEPLRTWLDDEAGDLKTADTIERAAAAWRANDHDEAWLIGGSRLTEAEALTHASGFADQLSLVADFLNASRAHENARADAERMHHEAELEAARALAAAETDAKEKAQAHAAAVERLLRESIAMRLGSDAVAAIAGITSDDLNRTLLKVLAAQQLSGTPDGGESITAAHYFRATLKIINTDARTVTFSPDGQVLASVGDHGSIQLWNTATGQPKGSLGTDHGGWVTSLAYSPDGTRLATTGKDCTIRLWNTANGQQVGRPLTGHTDEVTALAFSPDGVTLATTSGDATSRLWNTDTGQPSGPPLTGHIDAVRSVAYSPDGTHLATAGADRTVRIWNTVTGQEVGQPLTGHTGRVTSVAYSPDGTHLATAGADRTIRIWNTETEQSLGQVLTGHTGWVTSVAYSTDGTHLASGGADGTVRIWNTDTGQPLSQTLTSHTELTGIAYSPDGTHLATAGHDQTVRIWSTHFDQSTGQSLIGHTDWVTSVAYSPDGTHLASGGADSTIRIWNTATGQPVGHPLTGHTDTVRSVAYSPDGTHLATAGYDRTIRLWNTATGQQIGHPLTGHTDEPTSVTYSPDGTRLATTGKDCTIRLWNSATGQQVGQPLTGHTHWANCVAFSPNGTRIASGGEDGTVRIWPGPVGLRETLCSKITANMSHKQWNEWVSPAIDYIELCPGLPIPPDE